MTRKWTMAAAVCLPLILAGCSGKLFEVKGCPGGIPFFPLEVVETTTAVYEQQYFELKLEVDRAPVGTEPDPLKTTDIRFTTDGGRVAELQSLFARSENPDSAYNNLKETMTTDTSRVVTLTSPSYVPWQKVDTTSLALVSLTRSRRAQASATPQYINVKRVAAGSTQGKITLNKEGTLAIAEASTEDKTLELVLGALPVSAAVSKMLKLPTSTITQTTPTIKMVRFTVTPVVRRYVVQVERNLTAPGDSARYVTPVGNMEDASITLTEVRGSDGKKAPKKEEESPQIKITGAISLPGAKKEDKK